MAQICEISFFVFVGIIMFSYVAGGIFKLFLCCSRERGNGDRVAPGRHNVGGEATQLLLAAHWAQHPNGADDVTP